MKEEIGVIVGRFQSPRLHRGHRFLIETALNNHDRVFIFIGITPLKCTKNDPLTFGMRKHMIESDFCGVEVFGILDLFDPKKWSKELDRQLAYLSGAEQKARLYGSRDSFLASYKGCYPVEYLEEIPNISSTEIRRWVGIKPKNTPDFLEGAVWATQNQFSKVYATVDIAVYDSLGKMVLLGKKPFADLWRFPGGFSDITSKSFEDDALRELVEETHLVASSIEYLGSTLVDDPRYQSQTDKIKTLFYRVTTWEGNPVAGDDLEEVKWFKLNENLGEIMVPNHRVLLNMLLKA